MFRADIPCLDCKYLCRIDTGWIYCKKYCRGNRMFTTVSGLSYCAKFKPTKQKRRK